MSLPLTIHVPEPRSPRPAILALLAPPAAPVLLPKLQARWLTKNAAQFAREYENPDLTQPSVSSF
jgi:hypothetical protein